MRKIEPAGFPNPYLNCYESALMGILKYMGLPDETPLMGTQAYFVLKEDKLSVSPRFNFVSDEWKRIYGLTVETLPVADDADLQENILNKLDRGTPVCLPADTYYLPHTSYFNRLHQYHFIDIFGYNDNSYYVICPYYRFMGWMDLDIVHASFFSPTIYRKSIIFVPELKLQVLSSEMVCSLVEESCKYMLGLTVPALLNGTNHQFLGLAGIRSFDKILQQLIAKPNHESLSTVLNLSVDIISVGCSRYWFHKLIQTVQKELLPADTAANLQEQFTNLIQLWRTVGLRLGAGVHANQCNMMKQAASRLEQIYDQEYKIFNSLLDALPDHEGGII